MLLHVVDFMHLVLSLLAVVPACVNFIPDNQSMFNEYRNTSFTLEICLFFNCG